MVVKKSCIPAEVLHSSAVLAVCKQNCTAVQHLSSNTALVPDHGSQRNT